MSGMTETEVLERKVKRTFFGALILIIVGASLMFAGFEFIGGVLLVLGGGLGLYLWFLVEQ